jgi:uncharacterized membrane protein
MARRMRRRMSSFAYHVQKAYWRLVTAKPSLVVIAFILIAASVFLLGGGVYDLLEKPLIAVFQSGGTFISFYPFSLNEQLLIESVSAMTFYTIGIIGFLLAYQSTKYAYRPRQAFILLLIGCVLIVAAYIFVERSLLTKFG